MYRIRLDLRRPNNDRRTDRGSSLTVNGQKISILDSGRQDNREDRLKANAQAIQEFVSTQAVSGDTISFDFGDQLLVNTADEYNSAANDRRRGSGDNNRAKKEKGNSRDSKAQSDKKAKSNSKAGGTLIIRPLALVEFVLLIMIIAMAVLDFTKNTKLKAIQEEILHRPVYSAANPVIDNSIVEELERIQEEEEEKKNIAYSAQLTDETTDVPAEVVSEYAVAIDVNSDKILSQRNYDTRISPASMTKIMTVLVAAENIDESKLDDTFTITADITYYSYKNDCSSVGFSDGETVTVRDLFYGTILPSGADAAVGLAEYVAGSQEEFVKLMNEKLETLGLSESAHFTNCVGLYDEEHYCTVYDMAMILRAAIENDFVKEVMSAHVYTTSKTEQHPNGIEVSNWFLRRIEDKDVGGEVVCAKTGFVNESGNCAASYGSDGKGNDFIVVTGKSTSSWRCIYDHVAIYREYFPDYKSDGSDTSDQEELDEEEFDLSGNPEYSVNG